MGYDRHFRDKKGEICRNLGKYDLYLVRNFIKCQLQPKKCKKVSKYRFREPKYKPAFHGLHEKITFFRLHFKGIKR